MNTCNICNLAFCEFRRRVFLEYESKGINFPANLFKDVHDEVLQCLKCQKHEDAPIFFEVFTESGPVYFEGYYSGKAYYFIDDEDVERCIFIRGKDEENKHLEVVKHLASKSMKDENDEVIFPRADRALCFQCASKVGKLYSFTTMDKKMIDEVKAALFLKRVSIFPLITPHLKNNGVGIEEELKENIIPFLLKHATIPFKDDYEDVEIVEFKCLDGTISVGNNYFRLKIKRKMNIDDLATLAQFDNYNFNRIILNNVAPFIKTEYKKIFTFPVFSRFEDVEEIIVPLVRNREYDIIKEYPYLSWGKLLSIIYESYYYGDSGYESLYEIEESLKRWASVIQLDDSIEGTKIFQREMECNDESDLFISWLYNGRKGF